MSSLNVSVSVLTTPNHDMSDESEESNTEAISNVIAANVDRPRVKATVSYISSCDDDTEDLEEDLYFAKGNAVTSEDDSIEEDSKSGDEGIEHNDFDDALYEDNIRHEDANSRFHICTKRNELTSDPCKWHDNEEEGDDYGTPTTDDHTYLLRLFSQHKELASPYTYRLSNEAIKKLIMDFSLMRAHKCMTHAAAEGSWDFLKKMSSCVNIPTYATVRRRVGKHIPTASMTFVIKNHQDDTTLKVKGTQFNALRYGSTLNYTVVSEKCTVSLEEMQRFHHQMHMKCKDVNQLVNDIDLSFDGVPLDNSTHKKMMIYSVRFVGCKVCYVFGCHIYTGVSGYSVEEVLGPIVQELEESSFLRLRYVLADAPMRAFLKCIKGHNGYYCCELCSTSGSACLSKCKPKLVPKKTQEEEMTQPETAKKKNAPRKASNKQKTPTVSDTDTDTTQPNTGHTNNPHKSKTLYFEDNGEEYMIKPHTMVRFPPNSMFAKKRTSEEWKIIGERIVSRHHVALDNNKGITGLCPLFKLVGFNMIRDFPPDPMHFMMLGNGKRIVTQSLVAKRDTKKMIQAIDDVYRATSLTSECQRRTRSLCYVAHFKSSEFRALILVAFILLCGRFHEYGNQGEAKVWLLYCYICRVAMLPQPLYTRMKRKCNLALLVERFYEAYFDTFKKKNCVFNLHLFSHIFDIRDKEELDCISTEPFESSYNYVKRLYRAGTPSISKQVLENMFVLRMKRHICKPCVLIEPKVGRSKVRDDLIYTSDQKFYMVVDVMDNSLVCHAVIVEEYKTWIDATLNFTDVGVMTYKGIDKTFQIVIPQMDVIGKAVVCQKNIFSLPFGSNFT
jgi:hypothetical protein